MGKFIFGGQKIHQALIDSGLVRLGEDHVRRIVLDLQAGSAAKLYVEYFADEEKTIRSLKLG